MHVKNQEKSSNSNNKLNELTTSFRLDMLKVNESINKKISLKKHY
jgi:hypothetical protein